MHRLNAPLERHERFTGWIGLLTDLKALAKFGLAGLLAMLAVNWFAESLSPAVVVVGKGLISDAFHAVLSVFEKAKP